ncbi:MAG: fimbrillin family protein [Alistipes sp.]|nr:fimbrillin family protein [Alistipes sp.]
MKQLFFSLLAVAAMASCSKSELATRPEVLGTDEIKAKLFALSIDADASSRAPFEGTIDATSGNSLTAQVLASKTSGDYSTLYNDPTSGMSDKMIFSDNGTTEVGFDTTPAYFPADGSKIYLMGFYPYTGWTKRQNDDNNDCHTFTLTGKEDLMVAAEKGTDKAEAQAGTFPTLEFKHLLTKLDIHLIAEDQAAIDAWGDVTDIYLTKALNANIKDRVWVKYSDATVDFTVLNTPTDSITCYTMDATSGQAVATDDAFSKQTLTLTTTSAHSAYVLITPVIATGTNDYTLGVKTANHTDPFYVKVNLKDIANSSNAFTGDTTGKSFAVTLTFKATEIEAKATVTEWVDGGTADEEIQ